MCPADIPRCVRRVPDFPSLFVRPGRTNSGHLRLARTTKQIVGHAGSVTDLDWHPFNEQLIATGSTDCTVKLWQLPEGELKGLIDKPLVTLEGHNKRILYTTFHPCASNVLAVADFDKQCLVWDMQKSDEPSMEFSLKDPIQDIKWNEGGSLLGISCKDKSVRLFDPRAGMDGAIVIENAHKGGKKPTKLCFVDKMERLYTFGMGGSNAREAKAWDLRNPGKHIGKIGIDRGSGTLLPFYEKSTGLIFVGGKGDSKVRVMEATSQAPFIALHTQPRFDASAVGYCVVPKRALDTKVNEVAMILRLRPDMVEPLSFRIPRKAKSFQKDLYTDAPSGVPSMSADEWMNGKNEPPQLMSLDPKKRASYSSDGSGAVFEKAKSRADIEAELKAAKYKLRVLKAEVDLYKKQLAE